MMNDDEPELPLQPLPLELPLQPPADFDHNAMMTKLYGLQAGEVLVYYTGVLSCGREHSNGVAMVADLAWSLASKGRIRLFQRKTSTNQYDYIAIGVGAKTHYDHTLKDQIAADFAAVS